MDHSIAMGLAFAFTAVGGMASGVLADRYGRRTLVTWTILLYSAGTLLLGLATTRGMLFVARCVTGVGVGGEWAAGHALVAETFPPAYRGRAGAILQTGAPLGVGLATLVGTLVAPRVGWRAACVGASATGLLAFALRRGLPESDVWLAGRAERVGQGLLRLVKGDLRRPFYLTLVVLVMSMAAYWLTHSWLPEYLRSRGLTLAGSGAYMGLIVCAELVGYGSYGWFSDRLGRRTSYTLFAVTMAVGLVPLTFGWNLVAPRPVLLLLAMALVGFGTGTWSNMGPFLAELFPTEVRNTAMGSVYNLSRGAQLATPLLVAGLEPHYGLAAGVGLAALFSVAGGLSVWTLPETRGVTLTAR
jgi:MFS family permease